VKVWIVRGMGGRERATWRGWPEGWDGHSWMGDEWTPPDGTWRNHRLNGEWNSDSEAVVTVSMYAAMDAVRLQCFLTVMQGRNA
jgi:hypothetical protein